MSIRFLGALGLAVVGGSASGARILLSGTHTIADDASVGDLVGTFSVLGGSGSYSFTLTDDAGGLFAVDGDDLEVDGALDAGRESITVEADNGVDPPFSRTFIITVTEVVSSGPSLDFSDPDNSQYIPII